MNPYVTAGYTAVLLTLACYAGWLMFKASRLSRAGSATKSQEASPRG